MAELSYRTDTPKGVEIIDIKEKENILSSAILVHYDNPVEGQPEVFFLQDLTTKEGIRNAGYACQIMSEISTRVKEGNLIGLLKNGIKGSTKEKKFYENRGWEYLSENYQTWMYFLGRNITPKERESLKHLIKFAFPPEDFE